VLATPNKVQTANALRAATRALPDTPQTSEILRQLSAMVAASRTELQSIGPAAVATTGGTEPYPLTLSLTGRYFALQKFVRLLQQSADVKGDKITGKGRLYSIDSISFGGTGAVPGQGAGAITATMNLNAYVYGPPVAPPPATTTTSDTTTTASGTSP
jgi:hypothetical protein